MRIWYFVTALCMLCPFGDAREIRRDDSVMPHSSQIDYHL